MMEPCGIERPKRKKLLYIFIRISSKMSWQAYVNDQLLSTRKIKHAVICGHDGTMWASSSGFPVTADELKILVNQYEDVNQMSMNGLRLAGKKYMFLSNDPDKGVVRGKLKESGIHCIKTKQTYIICLYDETAKPQEVAGVTEKLGEYLVSVGY